MTATGVLEPEDELTDPDEVEMPELEEPLLPDELLPGAWPRATARELFTTTYDLLGPLAAHRVRQIIARYSPELAVHATHHSSELKMAADADGELAGSSPMVRSV